MAMPRIPKNCSLSGLAGWAGPIRPTARAGQLGLTALILAGCGSEPTGSLVRVTDRLQADRTALIQPRRIDLPVGVDPNFDQTDPLGTLKKIRLPDPSDLLARIASESAEPAKDSAKVPDTSSPVEPAKDSANVPDSSSLVEPAKESAKVPDTLIFVEPAKESAKVPDTLSLVELVKNIDLGRLLRRVASESADVAKAMDSAAPGVVGSAKASAALADPAP